MRALSEDAQESTVRTMMLRIAGDYDLRALIANDRAANIRTCSECDPKACLGPT
jgi:hypothetical protein